MSIDTARPGDFEANMTGTGDTTVIPAPTVAGAFIRILSITMTFSAATIVSIKSDASTTIKTLYGTSGGPVDLNDRNGIWDMPPGKALIINPSAGNVGVSGKYCVLGGG